MSTENGAWQTARKRPVEIEYAGPFMDPTVVETIEGDFEVDGEYIAEHDGYVIIQGVESERYPCGYDIFQETYLVDDDHPIREGAMLRCTSDAERVAPLLEVTHRYLDLDSGHYEYALTCPSHTEYHQYHQDDVDGLFVDTGLTNDAVKPIMDDEIRARYQELCDHSFHTVHDPETHEPTGEQCIACRARRDLDGGEQS